MNAVKKKGGDESTNKVPPQLFERTAFERTAIVRRLQEDFLKQLEEARIT